jgi:glycosyltransferase involved in cell wall biosynthesis
MSKIKTIVMLNITVFTPTYNRAYILRQLYNSLKTQEYQDFEWLVIDDGSNDSTEQLIESWMAEGNSFEIRYYKQPNGGKHRAINNALGKARGLLFFIVDSDDWLTPDALLKVATWEQSLPEGVKWCGVAGNLGTAIDYTPNTPLPSQPYDATLFERYTNVSGERAHVFYTEIAKKYPYPEFESEKFMTEAVVYNRMARDGYMMRFYDDIIWVYEYKNDGLTKAGVALFQRNPMGYGLWLREKQEFMKPGFVNKMRLQYSFLAEMKNLAPISTIAKAIGANRLCTYLFLIILKLRGL